MLDYEIHYDNKLVHYITTVKIVVHAALSTCCYKQIKPPLNLTWENQLQRDSSRKRHLTTCQATCNLTYCLAILDKSQFGIPR